MTGSERKQSSEAHMAAEVPARIERSVVLLRGQRVLLDETLAELYGVPVKSLNQAVKRNAERFPDDFMFQLTSDEHLSKVTNCDLRDRPWSASQIPSPRVHRAGRRDALQRPAQRAGRAREHRDHARMRRVMQEHEDLAQKLTQLERKCDGQFRLVFDAIRDLMTPPVKPKGRIGFKGGEG